MRVGAVAVSQGRTFARTLESSTFPHLNRLRGSEAGEPVLWGLFGSVLARQLPSHLRGPCDSVAVAGLPTPLILSRLKSGGQRPGPSPVCRRQL